MRTTETGKQLRVAAYCRVSTDKEDQLNSLSAQRQFFERYIHEHLDWSFVGIFADEGLSGTSIGHRPQFADLLRRAMGGEIDLILTKEVSRFARNTVDTLQVTRQLKTRGVGVLFLNDQIHTMEEDGEFRLTIMASVAQEESRKISERTRWGQLQAMRRGVAFGNDSIYGYTLHAGRLTVQPEQAEVIRLVYRLFLDEGRGAHTIARELTRRGVSTPLGGERAWSATMVLRLLRNEKYTGDLLQKKYRTTDYLSHRKIPNDRPEEQFCLRDHHSPIVSREQFAAVQAELDRRGAVARAGGRHSAQHWYSGKVRCANCGHAFIVKRTRRRDGGEYLRFVCRGRLNGEDCGQRAVPGRVLFAAVRWVAEALALDRASLTECILSQVKQLWQIGPSEQRLRQLHQDIQRQQARRTRAQEAFLDGSLTKEELHQVMARCQRESARLRQILTDLEREQESPDGLTERLAAAKAWLAQELRGGDVLLDELIRDITVEGECLVIRVVELPVRFRIWARGVGRGACYRVEVDRCDEEEEHSETTVQR